MTKLEHNKRYFEWFSLIQRIQHWLLGVSFILLAFTGLPMRFPEVKWLGIVYNLVGGLPIARIIHRSAAVVMIGAGIFHVGYLAALLVKNKFNVKQALPMLPTWKDAADWWETTKYYFGFQASLPNYDRFNFRESSITLQFFGDFP